MKTLGMLFFLLIWRAEASYIHCSESVSVYDTLQCTILETSDNWKLNYFHDVELSFAWQGKTVTSKMKWNNSTDKFENDELLETLLKLAVSEKNLRPDYLGVVKSDHLGLQSSGVRVIARDPLELVDALLSDSNFDSNDVRDHRMIELPCSSNSKMMLAPAADKLGLIWNTQSAVWLDTSEYEHFAVSTAGRIVKKGVSSWSSSPPPGKETFRKIHEQESITIDFQPLTTPGLAAIASDVKLFGVMPLNCDSNVDAFYAVTSDKFMLLTFTNTSDSTWTSKLLDQTAVHQEFFLSSAFNGDTSASSFKDFYINKKCEISVMEFPLGLKGVEHDFFVLRFFSASSQLCLYRNHVGSRHSSSDYNCANFTGISDSLDTADLKLNCLGKHCEIIIVSGDNNLIYTYDNGQNWYEYGFEKVNDVVINHDGTNNSFELLSIVSDPVNERLAVLTKCSSTNTFAAWLIVAEFEPKLKALETDVSDFYALVWMQPEEGISRLYGIKNTDDALQYIELDQECERRIVYDGPREFQVDKRTMIHVPFKIRNGGGDNSFGVTTMEGKAIYYTYDAIVNRDGERVIDLLFEAKISTPTSGVVKASALIYLNNPVPRCTGQSLVIFFNIDPPKHYVSMDYYSTFRNLMGHHWQLLYNETRYKMDEDVFSWREKGLGYDESFLDQLKKRHAEVMQFREVQLSDGTSELVRNTNCTTSAYPESVWASILHFLVHFSDINDSSCLDIPMVLQLPENYRPPSKFGKSITVNGAGNFYNVNMSSCEPWTNPAAAQSKKCLRCVQLYNDLGQIEPVYKNPWATGPTNICPNMITELVSGYQISQSLKEIGEASEAISAESLAAKDGEYSDGCEANNRSPYSFSSPGCLKEVLYVFRNNSINAICFKLELVKEDLGDIKVTLYEKNGRSPHFRDYFIFETSNSEYAIPKQYVGSCRQGSSLDHEFSGKIYPKTEDGQDTFKSEKHMEEDRHNRPLRMDDIYIVIPENRYGLYHFRMDLSSEFSFKEYAIEFGFYIEKSAAFGANASMAITAFVLFIRIIWVTIKFRRYLPTEAKKKMIVVHEEGDTSDEEEDLAGGRTMSLSVNPNFDYNINESDESDESENEQFGGIKIHPAEETSEPLEPSSEPVQPTPRSTFLGTKAVKDLIRRRSKLELEKKEKLEEENQLHF